MALCKRGWTMDAAPGAAVTLTNGRDSLEPFGVLPRLASGELTAEEWNEDCLAIGLIERGR